MNKRIYTAVICILVVMLFGACADNGTHVDKDYILQTTDVAQQNRIELEDYKINNSAMISLKDVIKLNNMNIESVSFYDSDDLMLLCANPEYTRMDVYTFSLDYGTLQWMGAIEGISNYDTQVVGYEIVKMDPLVIQEKDSNIFWVIKDKTVINELELDVEDNKSCVVSDQHIYFTDNDENAIKRVDLLTGGEEVFFKGIETYSYSVRTLESVSENGKYLYTTGVNKLVLQDITCVIDTETGKMVADVAGEFICWESKTANYAGYYENSVFNIHRRMQDDYYNVDVASISPKVAFEYCISNGDTVITIETDGRKYDFTSVNLNNMTEEYNSEIDMNSFYMSAFSEECNYSYCVINKEYSYNPKRKMVVFEVISDLGRRNVFLWDMNSAHRTDASVKTDSYSKTLNDHVVQIEEYGKISESVQSIYEEYGVAVYIGENVPHTFSDYRALVANDSASIQNAVKLIKKVLGYYPSGFFKDFTTNDYVDGINIYLVGDMTPLSDKYIDNPVGFSTEMKHYEVIALNINDITGIESNLCHEIAHAIYKRIKYNEIYSDSVYFDMSEWKKMNPQGFEYYNSYQGDYNGDLEYTGESYKEGINLNKIYFVDGYSKTMLEEDLARLMEYAMVKDDEPYLASPKIKNKMKYFCQVIRRIWNTKGWPEETMWERTAK